MPPENKDVKFTISWVFEGLDDISKFNEMAEEFFNIKKRIDQDNEINVKMTAVGPGGPVPTGAGGPTGITYDIGPGGVPVPRAATATEAAAAGVDPRVAREQELLRVRHSGRLQDQEAEREHQGHLNRIRAQRADEDAQRRRHERRQDATDDLTVDAQKQHQRRQLSDQFRRDRENAPEAVQGRADQFIAAARSQATRLQEQAIRYGVPEAGTAALMIRRLVGQREASGQPWTSEELRSFSQNVGLYGELGSGLILGRNAPTIAASAFNDVRSRQRRFDDTPENPDDDLGRIYGAFARRTRREGQQQDYLKAQRDFMMSGIAVQNLLDQAKAEQDRSDLGRRNQGTFAFRIDSLFRRMGGTGMGGMGRGGRGGRMGGGAPGDPADFSEDEFYDRFFSALTWIIPNQNAYYGYSGLRGLGLGGGALLPWLGAGAVGAAGLYAAGQAQQFFGFTQALGPAVGSRGTLPSDQAQQLADQLIRTGFGFGTTDTRQLATLAGQASAQTTFTNPNTLNQLVQMGMTQSRMAGMSPQEGMTFVDTFMTRLGLSSKDTADSLSTLQQQVERFGVNARTVRDDLMQVNLQPGFDVGSMVRAERALQGTGFTAGQIIGPALQASGFQRIQMAAILGVPENQFAAMQRDPVQMGLAIQRLARQYLQQTGSRSAAQGILAQTGLMQFGPNADAQWNALMRGEFANAMNPAFTGPPTPQADVWGARISAFAGENPLQFAGNVGGLIGAGIGSAWQTTTRNPFRLAAAALSLLPGQAGLASETGGFFNNITPSFGDVAQSIQKHEVVITVKDRTGRVDSVTTYDINNATQDGVGSTSLANTVTPSSAVPQGITQSAPNTPTTSSVSPSDSGSLGPVGPGGRPWQQVGRG